ncbi:low molecular weight phosphotyrosine protein phosphatase [Streptomyces castrisilvae]|uniref:protein-tyrosine-phosphatase n=1 Tax=Streptomyces castrisilvae TaxID=3033811 RepID=A0ABY9HH97_9ACTN|nr:low molecular weight phosphotyrosine protein phosphatase [Streptomyces sp. Mut1]WLQ33865.1 low molecular weight phosphotyrosine protein phosphatase [Streptomyces sp. Mut1]
MKNILTVCLGNYCRSPFAAAALARRGGWDVQVRSAGLIGKWQDQPANPAMIKAAARFGHDLSAHRAQQITLEALDWADTVLAMDTAILQTLRVICTEGNVRKLALYLGDRDVPDPMGQDDAVFNDCAVLIEAGTALHLGRRL